MSGRLGQIFFEQGIETGAKFEVYAIFVLKFWNDDESKDIF